MARMACTTKKKVCGGGTKTLIPPTKNLTVRIAIGVVAMDGYMQHWYVYWMKFLLMLSLCSLFTYAQDSFFDKFADMEGVTSVYISKAMLSLMPNMKTEGVNIGEVASKLDNIQILSCEKPDIIAKLKKETAFISPKNGYEELMRINDEGEKTIIYLKRNKNKEKEFVLMSQEKNEFTIIAITGNLTLQEIQGIINKE